MSRAFVREQDGADVPEDLPERPVSTHPNFVTPRGLKMIADRVRELESARDSARRTENKAALASVERDLRYWLQRRASAKPVEPQPGGTVRFGTRVTVGDLRGRERLQIGNDKRAQGVVDRGVLNTEGASVRPHLQRQQLFELRERRERLENGVRVFGVLDRG